MFLYVLPVMNHSGKEPDYYYNRINYYNEGRHKKKKILNRSTGGKTVQQNKHRSDVLGFTQSSTGIFESTEK